MKDKIVARKSVIEILLCDIVFVLIAFATRNNNKLFETIAVGSSLLIITVLVFLANDNSKKEENTRKQAFINGFYVFAILLAAVGVLKMIFFQ